MAGTLTPTARSRDVVHAAWLGVTGGAGAPRANKPTGQCARCASDGAVVPVKECISRSFTGYDTWRAPTSSVLCAACAWCYRAPQVRSMLLLVCDDGRALQITRARACYELLHGLGEHRALVLPLRGRKHLLAQAAWGSVSTEAGTLAWGVREADLLADVVAARAAGASGVDLAAAAPPWSLLSRQPAARRGELMDLWARMEPLRRSDLRLHVASVVTSPDKPAAPTGRRAPTAA